MELHSKRLTIRDSVFEDCELFFKWESQPFIKRCFSISEGETMDDIVSRFILRREDPTIRQYTLLERESGRPIGRIYLTRYDKKLESVDINRIYIGEEKLLGGGLGEEAFRLLVKHCFEDLGVYRLELNHYPDNRRASRLYCKAGFHYEGCLRSYTKRDGVFYDQYQMCMLRPEYDELCAGGDYMDAKGCPAERDPWATLVPRVEWTREK